MDSWNKIWNEVKQQSTIAGANRILRNINIYNMPPTNNNNEWVFSGGIHLNINDEISHISFFPPIEEIMGIRCASTICEEKEEEEKELKFNYDNETEEIRTWMRHQFSELHFFKRDKLILPYSNHNESEWEDLWNWWDWRNWTPPQYGLIYEPFNFEEWDDVSESSDSETDSDESDLPSFRSDEARIDTEEDSE